MIRLDLTFDLLIEQIKGGDTKKEDVIQLY